MGRGASNKLDLTGNLGICRGDTFQLCLDVDDEDGDPIDYTTHTAKMIVRRSLGGDALVTLVSGVAYPAEGIDLDTLGEVKAAIAPATTAALSVGKYVYDLKVKNAGGTLIDTVVWGTVEVVDTATGSF